MASDRDSRDPFQPVDFVPVRIGRRRRTLDPLVAGALVVVIGLVTAIVKPWDSETATSPSSAPGPSAAVATLPSAAAPAQPGPEGQIDAVALLRALVPHDEWGVRIVLETTDSAGRSTLQERWRPVGPAWDPPDATAFRSDDPIAAIGVTAPADETPLAVRVWADDGDGGWRWLDARRPASDRAAADLLLLPPPMAGATSPASSWSAGRYRLDLLMGSSVARIDVSIDTPGIGAPVPSPSTVGSGQALWLGNVTTGPYVVADQTVTPLVGTQGDLLDPASAWLDVAEQVASTSLLTATGLGVLLPAGARDASGLIRRLAPDPVFDAPLARTGMRYDADNDPTPFIQFDSPRGSPWPAGVYALQMAWDASDGHHTGTWHVELRPGDALVGSALLDATRRYASRAGTNALVLSGAGRRQLDPAAAPVRALPFDDAIGCGDRLIDETPAVLGIALPEGVAFSGVALTLHGPLDQSLAVRTRTARDVLPGLSLVAPARGASFAAGVYRLAFDTDTGRREVTMCLGTSPFSG